MVRFLLSWSGATFYTLLPLSRMIADRLINGPLLPDVMCVCACWCALALRGEFWTRAADKQDRSGTNSYC